MTHPGVGPLQALAYVLIIGTPTRFHRGKQIGHLRGMIRVRTPGWKTTIGHISKQGSSLVALLLWRQPSSSAIQPDWRRRYLHLAMRRTRDCQGGDGRRLAVRLYWMWRNGCEYSPSLECGSYVGQLGTDMGVQ